MRRLMQLSSWARLNVIGLALAAAGMLLQMAAGSDLYPTVTGPIVLFAAAVLVALGSPRWTRFIGLGVPLLLGVGAIVAAVMTGELVDQLASLGNPAIVVGTLMHVVGLGAAVTGGVGMLLDRRSQVSGGR